MSIFFTCDRMGFPLVEMPQLGCAIHVCPITKVQFEVFLAEANPSDFDNNWYESILKLNPRAACTNISQDYRERQFITGLLPIEWQRFAAWMGMDYDIPTIGEWRSACSLLQQTNMSAGTERQLVELQGANPKSVRILKQMIHALRPKTLFDLSLMQDGLVEWVKDEEQWRGIGKPRHRFYPNEFTWLDPIDPTGAIARIWFCGLRLLRRSNLTSKRMTNRF